jgi:RNA polymerase sigma-70 factor (ECF subfamily)
MSDPRTAIFNANRGRLLGIAYRMLGEMSAAEDIAQEAWLRWRRAEGEDIRDPRAWLSAVTVRLALDALKSARARRETYVGPWLPEPLLPDDMRTLAADAPAARAELASDLSLALLHVLERLSPEERAAFILHDAFDAGYSDIAATLGKSEEACRKLVSRGRERVKSDRPRHAATAEQHRALVQRFAAAAATYDMDQLKSLLAEDAVFYSDGGGRVPAAINPVFGADRVARLIAGIVRKLDLKATPILQPVELNGQFGLLTHVQGHSHSAMTADVEGDRITAVYLIRNPEKLARFAAAVIPPSSPGSSASA